MSDAARKGRRRLMVESKPDVVIDTNVLVEFFSATDLLAAHANMDPGAVDSPQLRDRRIRARESLLLAWCLETRALCSLSLGEESKRVLVRDADPSALGTFESQFVQVSIYFVKDHVFPLWAANAADSDKRGNDADRFLVEEAERLASPLVSNERNPTKALGKHAAARGVRVQTPREYWESQGLEEDRAIEELFVRFDAVAPAFLDSQDNSAAATRAVKRRRAIWEYLLRGKTPNGPVSIR